MTGAGDSSAELAREVAAEFAHAFDFEHRALTDRLHEVVCQPKRPDAIAVSVIVSEREMIVTAGAQRSELGNDDEDRRLLREILAAASTGSAEAR